mgnify:CR=1 FL=1
MGFPEGWGDHSPHPFGDPPHHVGELKKENEVNPMYTQFFIPMQPPTTTHNAKQLHAYMKAASPVPCCMTARS